jgi:putative oxidoreductase
MTGQWSAGRIARMVATWLFTLFLVMVFARQGWAKFSADSGWGRAFDHWGFPDWFRILIGVVEISAAVLLLVPRAAPIGAMLIILTMIGGIATHVTAGDAHWFRSETMPIVLASLILLLRRDRLQQLFGAVSPPPARAAGLA